MEGSSSRSQQIDESNDSSDDDDGFVNDYNPVRARSHNSGFSTNANNGHGSSHRSPVVRFHNEATPDRIVSSQLDSTNLSPSGSQGSVNASRQLPETNQSADESSQENRPNSSESRVYRQYRLAQEVDNKYECTNVGSLFYSGALPEIEIDQKIDRSVAYTYTSERGNPIPLMKYHFTSPNGSSVDLYYALQFNKLYRL
jgi:hypothetical protein